MRLEELIEELQALPKSALTADVLIMGELMGDSSILGVDYMDGEVRITCEGEEDDQG